MLQEQLGHKVIKELEVTKVLQVHKEIQDLLDLQDHKVQKEK